MKRLLFTALFLIYLLAPVILPAEQSPQDSEEMTETEVLLTRYKEAGYNFFGPIQYLGKTSRKIKLYDHSPIAYKDLDVMDQKGEEDLVNKYDFVYVLSKDGQIILIRLDKGNQDNE
ncbi:MAG: hypothetical protein K9K81_01905 [Desulfobacteraceae bacterium]|nr:hypothetical protein [Desulfobacteraceae bacterium]